jgi:carboxypeptidase Taq
MNKLKKLFKNYYILNDISGILFWDNATNLPSNSITSRSEQMTLLAEYTDKIFRSPEVLNEISVINSSDLNEIDLKNLRLMKNIILRENSVDTNLKSELIKQKLKCEHLWRKSRQENNSLIIEKDFNYLLSLVHEEASQLSQATQLSPYDSLISKYDMDYNSSKIDGIFSVIKSEIIPQYLNSDKIKDPCVFHSSISEEKVLEDTKKKTRDIKF